MPDSPARTNAPPPPQPIPWSVGGRQYDLSTAGMVMGIVNITPDSFSDGGSFFDPESALRHALEHEAAGAQIVDFGGESTRPGAAVVTESEEAERVLPAIGAFAARRVPGTLISIDTSKPGVAEAALAAGADIINDITGLQNPAMRAVAAASDCGLVLMHMLGTPQTMQDAPTYEDVSDAVLCFFEQQIAACRADGIAPERIALDPGIGFGKTLEHNLELLRRLPELRVTDRPLLVGVSRKSFIGKVIGSDALEARDWPTVALTSYCRERGAEIHRVHDSQPNVEALRMTEAILFGA